MSVKDEFIKLIQELPDTATAEDILYRLHVRASIEEGLAELDAGKGISHSEMLERMKKWLN